MADSGLKGGNRGGKRYTREQQEELRLQILSSLQKNGGSIDGGSKTIVNRVMELTGFPSRNGLVPFLKRMERDGLVTLALTEESGFFKGVAIAGQKEKVEERTEVAETVEVAEPEPVTEPAPATVDDPLTNLKLRVSRAEDAARDVLVQADQFRLVIEFLENPPPEYDATNPIRAERDHLQGLVTKLREDQKRLVSQAEKAKIAQQRAESQAAEVAMLNVGLARNLNTMLNRRSRSGITIRELLPTAVTNDLERMMKQVPGTK